MLSKPLDQQVTDLLASLENYKKEVKDTAGDILATNMLLIESNMKRNTPVDTGRLRSANRGLFNRNNLSGALFNNVSYAYAVEFGLGRGIRYPADFFYIQAEIGFEKIVKELKIAIGNVKLK